MVSSRNQPWVWGDKLSAIVSPTIQLIPWLCDHCRSVAKTISVRPATQSDLEPQLSQANFFVHCGIERFVTFLPVEQDEQGILDDGRIDALLLEVNFADLERRRGFVGRDQPDEDGNRIGGQFGRQM